MANGVYIWQRLWTPSLISAIGSSAPLVDEWRILVGETDDTGQLSRIAVDWESIPKSSHALVAVMRIDGRLEQLDQERLLTDIAALTTAISSQGTTIRAVEIDYDSATSQLLHYSTFLAALRSRLHAPVHLSITVLPDWISSPSLAPVLAQADEFVLQLHAVRNPKSALFDAELASGWITEFADKTSKPFRVALPTYGSRVVKDKIGQVIAVDSETPSLVTGNSAREVIAAPLEISTFVKTLGRRPPANLVGIVWFRLPVIEDRRAWGFRTWEAVMKGGVEAARLNAELRPTSTPGMQNVMLANRGTIDGRLPNQLTLSKECEQADGANGYELSLDEGRLVLNRVDDGLIHPGRDRLIGWARCPSTSQVSVDAEP